MYELDPLSPGFRSQQERSGGDYVAGFGLLENLNTHGNSRIKVFAFSVHKTIAAAYLDSYSFRVYDVWTRAGLLKAETFERGDGWTQRRLDAGKLYATNSTTLNYAHFNYVLLCSRNLLHV